MQYCRWGQPPAVWAIVREYNLPDDAWPADHDQVRVRRDAADPLRRALGVRAVRTPLEHRPDPGRRVRRHPPRDASLSALGDRLRGGHRRRLRRARDRCLGVALPDAPGRACGLVPLLYAALAREGSATRTQPAHVAATPRVAAPWRPSAPAAAGRPVLLATLRVAFDPSACELAVDAAVESGQPLIVAVLAELPPLPLSVMLGYDQVDSPEDAAAFAAPAALAASLGVAVERLRIRSPRPVTALLELAIEREPGLLVFGPERALLKGRVYRKAVRALRERAPCLVWTPDV